MQKLHLPVRASQDLILPKKQRGRNVRRRRCSSDASADCVMCLPAHALRLYIQATSCKLYHLRSCAKNKSGNYKVPNNKLVQHTASSSNAYPTSLPAFSPANIRRGIRPEFAKWPTYARRMCCGFVSSAKFNLMGKL
jgi:hypothetical protein